MEKNTQPLITVYIPTFNRMSLLKRALESVRNQTYSNLEIIVVDDCSSDGTVEYMRNQILLDSRIKFFEKKINGGACESRNIAINHAQGEFITGLDDDDYFEEKRIEIFLDYWKIKKENTIALASKYLTAKNKKHKNKKRLIMKKDLLYGNFLGNQIFIRTQNLKELNGFDIEFKMWQDLDMWYRVASLGNFEVIPHATYYFDTTHLGTRISNSKSEIILKTRDQFCKKYSLSKFDSRKLNNHIYMYRIIKKDHFACFFKDCNKIVRKLR